MASISRFISTVYGFKGYVKPHRLLIAAIQIGTEHERKSVRQHEDSPQAKAISKEQSTNNPTIRKDRTPLRDYITIVDIDAKGSKLKGKKYDSITIPTIPLELSYEVESTFATIASFGRNNPFYHFTGSEDTLNFQIDYYSKQRNKADVIYWCRWMESLTKANGYGEAPHRVMVLWGSDDVLFNGDVWLVTKASYKLAQFQPGMSMLPQQAYQDITLKRVTPHNRTIPEVMKSNGTVNEYTIKNFE